MNEPFVVGDRVKHRGTGLENILMPFLSGANGTVKEMRTRYKYPNEYIAHVLFDDQVAPVPINCNDLSVGEPTGKGRREMSEQISMKEQAEANDNRLPCFGYFQRLNAEMMRTMGGGGLEDSYAELLNIGFEMYSRMGEYERRILELEEEAGDGR